VGSKDFSSASGLVERRALLKSVVVIRDRRIRIADYFEAAPKDLLSAVREQRLEGIIGKQTDSHYQPGKRSGAWIKYRVNRGQEFVIGGYFPGPHGIDSLIVGYYEGDKLMYVARTRNGFVPVSRRQVFSKLKHLVTPTCPFVNLPEMRRFPRQRTPADDDHRCRARRLLLPAFR
jgi:ATP-dependent DNA ligase